MSDLSPDVLDEVVAEAEGLLAPPPVTHVTLRIETVRMLADYLVQRPFGEVRGIVEAIERDANDKPEE